MDALDSNANGVVMPKLKFEQIKSKYSEFERELMRNGKLPMRDTGIGFWNGAVCDDIFQLFKKIGLQKYNNFLDLGSGDGRVVLIASLFTNASGVEYDKPLVEKAEEIKNSLRIKNAVFHHKNFHEHNISAHDIVFISPDAPMHRGVESKLLAELRGKLIVYGPHFHPTLLVKEKEFWINNNFAAVYGR